LVSSYLGFASACLHNAVIDVQLQTSLVSQHSAGRHDQSAFRTCGQASSRQAQLCSVPDVFNTSG